MLEKLRTEAAEAIEAANSFLLKYPNPESQWLPEDRTAFEKHMEIFRAANAKIPELEKHEKIVEEVRRGQDFYAGSRGTKNDAQVNEEQLRDLAIQQHSEAFHALMRGNKSEAVMLLHQSEVPDSVWKRLKIKNLDGKHRPLVDVEGKLFDKHALMASIDSAGGFTAPVDFIAQLQKDLAAVTSLISKCRMIPTSRGMVSLPALKSHATLPKIYPSKFVGSWVNEEDRTVTAQTKQGGSGYFEMINIPVGIYEPPLIPITLAMLEETAINLEGELSALLAEISGLDLENGILTGDGLLRSPMGVIPTISADSSLVVNSGAAATILYGLFSRMNAALAPQYHAGAVWVFNQNTLATIHAFAGTTNDHPLVQAFMTQDLIYGKPYVLSNFMPDEAADAYPVILGNFNFYGVPQMNTLGVKVYDQTTPGMHLLYSRWRVGGGVIRKQAFRVGKCATL